PSCRLDWIDAGRTRCGKLIHDSEPSELGRVLPGSRFLSAIPPARRKREALRARRTYCDDSVVCIIIRARLRFADRAAKLQPHSAGWRRHGPDLSSSLVLVACYGVV